MAKVEIYSTNACSSCMRVKELLAQKNISFTEYKVDEDQDKFKEMKLRTNGARAVPAIFIDDIHIGGFDALWALEKAGELDAKLK